LAAALKESFDSETLLIEGGQGIFDVRLEGELIFSKDEVGRFPENDEVIQLVRDQQE
jgi:selenoprotein W-related protein